MRKRVALAKVAMVIEHVEDALESGKVILFGHHREALEAFAAHFGKRAVLVYGGMTDQDKENSKERFQNDPACDLFIGGLKVAGVGLTLTASSHVIFAELDWVPGNVTQCEDRAHRIGQRESVLVQHLVLEGSLDAHMARVIVEKQGVADAALDNKLTLADPVAPVKSITVDFDAVMKEAAKLEAECKPEQLEAIHLGLKMLAGVCDGASARDNVGFSGADARIGHAFANARRLTPRMAVIGRKLVRKYRRQLPETLLETVIEKELE